MYVKKLIELLKTVDEKQQVVIHWGALYDFGLVEGHLNEGTLEEEKCIWLIKSQRVE